MSIRTGTIKGAMAWVAVGLLAAGCGDDERDRCVSVSGATVPESCPQDADTLQARMDEQDDQRCFTVDEITEGPWLRSPGQCCYHIVGEESDRTSCFM